MTPARQVATKLCRDFPNAATLTLAKRAYKENPELWMSIETCRSMIRKIRGNSGDANRAKESDKSLFREPQKPGDPFAAIPDPVDELEDWKIVEMGSGHSVLCISDIHIPFHAKDAITLALQYGKDRGVDFILLNGDLCDFFTLSRFQKDPRLKNFPGEIKMIREFLSILRAAFPDARIVLKLGNHEERYGDYMQVKAPELLGLPEFEFESVLQLSKFGIELVGNRCPIKIGELFFLHGHEYTFAISNPVSPARGLMLRTIGVHAVCGHFHQPTQQSERNLKQSVISTWSTGCLCNLHPHWLPLNKWCHGFMVAEIDNSGAFTVENKRIIDGKVWS